MPQLKLIALSLALMAGLTLTVLSADARGEARRGGHAPVAEVVEEAAPVESPVGGHASVQESAVSSADPAPASHVGVPDGLILVAGSTVSPASPSSSSTVATNSAPLPTALGSLTTFISAATFDAAFPGAALEDFEREPAAPFVGFGCPTLPDFCYPAGNILDGIVLAPFGGLEPNGPQIWTLGAAFGVPSRVVGNILTGSPFDDPAADTEILLPLGTCAAGFDITDGDLRVVATSALPQTIALGQVTVSFYGPSGLLGSVYVTPPAAPVFTFVGGAHDGGITRITIVDDPTTVGPGGGLIGLAELIDDLRVVPCADEDSRGGGPGPDGRTPNSPSDLGREVTRR